MLNLKKPLLVLVGVMAFAVSCGGTKKKNQNAQDPNMADQNQELQLNADSDSGTFGALKTVYFPFNSASLRESAKQVLDANSEYLKANGTLSVQIEGHCDERGGVQFNLALGEKRSQKIKDYLVASGVDANRLTTISFGKERPIALGHDEVSWSKNRRGNFVLTAK